MSAAQFKLDMFEGPLDLLLHLISKHKLNIYDIEISLLLEQYMDYINDLDHEDYEDAADFLEMAARLIYIKTCSLLTRSQKSLKKSLKAGSSSILCANRRHRLSVKFTLVTLFL